MDVQVRSVTGFYGAFVSMFMSKRTWTPELDDEIYRVCDEVIVNGRWSETVSDENMKKFTNWFDMLLRMGIRHITVLRFITVTLMTEGMHRGGQDDIDSHVRRFDNRFIRSSTRLATFDDNEKSEFYQDKILTDGEAARYLGFNFPDTIEYEGSTYVKSTNGYVKEIYKDDKDVKRGLYMLSIPSNFISEINLCEWAHVFKERNSFGSANPEVKCWAEMVTEQLHNFYSGLTRSYFLEVKN